MQNETAMEHAKVEFLLVSTEHLLLDRIMKSM